MQNKISDSEFATFERIDGIIYGTYKPNVALDIKVAEITKKQYLDFIEKSEELLISDGRNLTGISKEAREFYGGEMGVKGVKACALINNSFVTKTIINLFLKINKPAVPTKMFSDVNEAAKWLKELTF